MNADVVVVGAGLAGLVAANRAAALGRSVIVLEQGADEDYLCNARIATGVFNIAHSDPELPPQELVAAIKDDTEGHADPALAAAVAAVAGSGLAWLRAEGAELLHRVIQNKHSWMIAPPRPFAPGLDWRGRGMDLLLRRLAANLKRRGGQLVLRARARELVMEARACRGLQAEIEGRKTSLEARCVLLADGGFQANAEMVRRYISPKPEALVQRSAGTGRGDAIQMAQAAGAKLVDMDRFYGHLLSRATLGNNRLWPYPTLDSLTGGSILIDRSGRRFADEGLGGIALANVLARREDPLDAYIVFDEAIWSTTGRDESVPPNPSLAEVHGAIITAPDLAGLARSIGLPPAALAQTVASYNAAIREGRPDRLSPPRTPGRRFAVPRQSADRVIPRAVEGPRFYAAPLCAGISCTMGGIAIDAKARALREDLTPIDGLFAAGSATGGLEGGPIAGYIGGLGKAYCLGLIAGSEMGASR